MINEHTLSVAPITPPLEHALELAQPPGTDVGEEQQPRGLVLAVLGSKGSPGASECAWSLAALADRRWPTLLVECDLLGGSLAFRLAADPTVGSLLGVANAVASSATRELAELVERWLCGGSRGWPPTLLAPAAAQLTELPLRADALVAAIDALALMFPLVVCDVGWLLDPECGAGRCHAAILERADAQLLVAGSRGPQLIAARTQLEQLLGPVGLSPTRLRVILNTAGSAVGAADRLERARFEQDLAAYGLSIDGVLPVDVGGVVRASRGSRPLVCARRRSGYRGALGQLLEQLFVGSPPKRRLQRTRLRLPATRDAKRAVAIAAVADGLEEVVLPWSSR